MIIIKFALVLFVVTATAIIVIRNTPGPMVGGPYLFVEMPQSRNPVQSMARVNPFQALKRRNLWRIWFNAKGLPVKMRLYRDKVPVYAEELYWDKNGKFWKRVQVEP